MYRRILGVMIALAFVVPTVTAQGTPDTHEILEKMLAAAGGDAFAKLGILELDVDVEETRNDGTRSVRNFRAFVDTSNLSSMRVEFPDDVVVVATPTGGWSTTDGVLDDRPQTPKMAKLTTNQSLFPLLLPYSLQMEGVWLDKVYETTLDERDVWVISMPFAKGFFSNPVMETTWVLVVAQDDYSIVSLEFAPSPAFADVAPVGVRYRILKQKDLEGALVAEQVLAIGINSQHQESGANRITRIVPKVRPWDATLFLSPKQLEELEEED